ncbi:MAG: Cytochrome c oxidase subunit 3 [Pseudomonadota bacterium]
MSSTAHGTTPYYYVPHPSRHPAMAAFGLFLLILGAGQWINGEEWGKYSLFAGLIWFLVVLYQWSCISGSVRPSTKAKAGSLVTRLICHTAGA